MDNELQLILARVVAHQQTTRGNGTARPRAGTDDERFQKIKEEEARFRREQLAKDIEHAGIFARYRSVTFAAIEARGLPENPSIRENYAIVKDYAAHLAENIREGIGLIFAGGCGTMKTTLAVAVLRQHIEAGGRGLILPMCSLIDHLYTLRTLNREEWARFEERIRRTPLLIIDDLGGENTDQSWVLAKVDSILTDRYNRQRPTIITTNLTQKELLGTYSGRLMDRLKSTSRLLVFRGSSERGVLA
ncbi:ATP-binding protein [uncultured Selenomonas sp.]|uniref:ATP-binding protein n=1 Tax=uncultured Selenomonas sp. TaxID=159275 RepID=UPI0025EBE4A1|nr:ATP-binding protein [uncultured Selenomonas sp.]